MRLGGMNGDIREGVIQKGTKVIFNDGSSSKLASDVKYIGGWFTPISEICEEHATDPCECDTSPPKKIIPPIDRTATTTLHGTPVNELHTKQASEPTGMHSDYLVLNEEERSKGFVRPVRRSYIHLKCGAETSMGRAPAETYARDPKFYGATFCCHCNNHYPVGIDGEFVWDGTDEKVGT